ncbi:MAG: MtrAB system histidine kinase MtrB [Microbacteriaceae bacterium]|jgi:two-component system sensor histidine kinase MtrB|nr:MtrAB system histidine kinase MtrB [Microbacteriaceae bacterium]MCI1206972.1 MtrAB system histidine kinase MtrB [Microbacteriaceae bacterium]
MSRGRAWGGRIHALASRARRSLRVRSVMLTIVLSVIAAAAVHGYIGYRISQQLYHVAVSESVETSTRTVSQVQSALSSSAAQTPGAVQTLLNSLLATAETASGSQRVALLHTPQDDVVPITQDVLSSQLESTKAIPSALRLSVKGHPNDLGWKAVRLPGSSAPGIVVGASVNVPLAGQHELYIFYDFSSQQSTLVYAQWMLFLAAVLLVFLVGLITWFTVGLVLRPVRQTAAISQQLASGDLTRRLPVRGADEIVSLAESFNTMADSLQQRIVELGRLSELQRRFVSDVSHELRTPLTTIALAESVLYDKRRTLGEEKRRTVELLHDEVDRFTQLLADLLEMSRFDAGAQEADQVPFDLSECVRSMLLSELPIARRMGCELRLRAPERLPVVSDSRRVGRILRNFLTNACEHGHGKPVEVTVRRSARAALVLVRDHGPGLSEEQQRHVFERFWRGDTSRQRTLGGNGLGLSIAWEDARLLGGSLGVWSQEGQGAVFGMQFPISPEDPAVEHASVRRPSRVGPKLRFTGEEVA